MVTTLDTLKADPKYRALDVPTQMEVARRLLSRDLPLDPEYTKQDVLTQDLIFKRLISRAPTFNDPETESYMGNFSGAYLSGNADLEKQANDFVINAVQGSGIAGLAGDLFSNPKYVPDRQRIVDYYRSVDELSGRSDISAIAGTVFGTLADVAGVSLVSLGSGAVGAASKAIQVASAGGKAAFNAAKAANIAIPVVKPLLASLGPIAAESAIEAIPYFFLSEQVLKQQGKTTAWEQGTGEVAKTFGMNAALDFAAGTAVIGALKAGGRLGKILFGTRKAVAETNLPDDTIKTLLDQDAIGTLSDEILGQLDPLSKSAVLQRRDSRLFTQLDSGNPDLNQWGRDALLGETMGRVIAKEETEKGTLYKVFDYTKDGRAVPREYSKVNDMEDYLAYRYYENTKDLPANTLKLNPINTWAYARGKTLYTQGILLEDTVDPILEPMKKSTNIPYMKNAEVRPIITPAEADSIKPKPNQVVFKTQLPINGKISDAINNGELYFMKNQGPLTASQSLNPNAVLVGVNGAPKAVYEEALLRAQELVSKESYRTLDEAVATLLLNKGYDHYLIAPDKVQFFSPHNLKLLGTPDDILSSAPVVKSSGELATRVIFSEERKALVKGSALLQNDDLLLEGAIKAVRSGNPDDLMNLSKSYLTAVGDPSMVKILRSDLPGPVSFKSADGVIEITVPKSVKTAAENRAFINEFFTGLKKFNAPGNSVNPKSGDYYEALFRKDSAKFTLGNAATNSSWINLAVKQLGATLRKLPDGTLAFKLGDTEKVFALSSDLVNYLGRRIADPSTISSDMAKQGITVFQGKDGLYRAIVSKSEIITGNSIHDLAEKLNYVPTKLDRRYGPSELEITKDGISVTIDDSKTLLGWEDTVKLLSRFTDTAKLAKLKILKITPTKELAITPLGKYRIELPEMGVIREFDDLAEARKFVESEVKDLDTLKDIANRKNLRLYREPSGYSVWDDTTKHTASSMDELKAIFKKFPDIQEAAPDLIKLDPDVESTVAEVMKAFKSNRRLAGENPYNLAPEFAPEENVKRLSSGLIFRQFTSEFFSWATDAAHKTGHTGIIPLVNKFKLATRRSSLDQQTTTRLLNNAFHTPSGKLLSSDSRKKIYYHAGAAVGSEEAESLGEQYATRYKKPLEPLTKEEEIAKDKLLQVYKSLSEKFGIDYGKLIHNYMPRLREKAHLIPADELAKMATAQDLLKKIPLWADGKVPKEIRFWAEHERVDEIAQFWVKDDALEVALIYSTQGHKKLYINPVWKEYSRYEVEAKLEEDFKLRMNQYRMDMMGSNQTHGEKVVAEFGGAFFRELKRSKIGGIFKGSTEDMEDKGRGLLNAVMSLTYLGSMGWKPFLAVRNSFQIFTTLAPRFGLDWTLRASDKILKDPAANFVRLRKLGILSEKPPIVNAIYGTDSILGKVEENAFNWFKNSDDFSRAVAYTAGELRFENAISAIKTGSIKSKEEFFGFSALSRIDPESADEVWNILNKDINNPANIAAARDRFASIVQISTMFDYSGASSPGMTRGVMGKLFGQFGSFSASYRANLASMVKYGTKKEIAESVITYLSLSAALSGAFAAMQIKTNDFTPVMPGLFTGGPLFDMPINALRSLDTGYEGSIARANIARDAPLLFPGSAQLKYAFKAAEALSGGDAYGAFLSVNMIPMIK